MKNTFYFLLIFALFAAACGDDDDDGQGPIFPNAESIINLDAENFSAPQMPAGQYEMAAFFPASFMQQYQGRFLKDVSVYLTNVPAATAFFIYGPGIGGTSGAVLYNADVSSTVQTDSWNTHQLSPALEITGEDLWIAVMVDHPSTFGSVGCDEGPANANGDLLFEYGTSDWTTLRQFTNNQSNINWNIRGNIGD